ncbi:hypothetical protein HELRODRAFT_166199 [Helobdella robusta]|uniref:SAM domain-containing protein n=1 Tax=Helobdella robusta TaxID=6412 RepID=T1EXW3_HELRO|nr:hypothetical protein HELRODRAFT_166199 [Helobdella robusta]ESN90525.1 hypothetical protein HELRODRAFT_166199 [Helobdella robusta]
MSTKLQFMLSNYWTVNQVVDWLKGLDLKSQSKHYEDLFYKENVVGRKLLDLTNGDLLEMGLEDLRDQEHILFALSILHAYMMTQLNHECFRTCASCLEIAAKNLLNHIRQYDIGANLLLSCQLEVLRNVENVLISSQKLIKWLDKLPISSESRWLHVREVVLKSSKALGQYKKLSEYKYIEYHCKLIIEQCQAIVLNYKELALFEMRKYASIGMFKEDVNDELGIVMKSSADGLLYVSEFPASSSTRLDVSDELVQINGQTIIGWCPAKVMELVRLLKGDVRITVRKKISYRKDETHSQHARRLVRLNRLKHVVDCSKFFDTLPCVKPERNTNINDSSKRFNRKDSRFDIQNVDFTSFHQHTPHTYIGAIRTYYTFSCDSNDNSNNNSNNCSSFNNFWNIPDEQRRSLTFPKLKSSKRDVGVGDDGSNCKTLSNSVDNLHDMESQSSATRSSSISSINSYGSQESLGFNSTGFLRVRSRSNKSIFKKLSTSCIDSGGGDCEGWLYLYNNNKNKNNNVDVNNNSSNNNISSSNNNHNSVNKHKLSKEASKERWSILWFVLKDKKLWFCENQQVNE